ncbi:MAG TPA: SAM-dependent methyltransferase [Rhodocyclaceae bacterium]|nr:SAM-dependent methyltransferase [Rhodocyclaceae bacterium]HMZ74794.1 SAM-dependent methyltransferase [Rhodocyclaceae bacterium]HND24740.1 SAM-dependent methyltransferase [Rhodocyclaceae bacterium]
MAGTLYLVPVSLGPAPTALTTPAGVAAQACALDYFVVENAKSARAELKRLEHPRPLRELDIRELPDKPNPADLDALLAPILAGTNGGLMSEAGCPAVADPGALLVRRAHEAGVRVVPLVGPSSLLLALMASGLNGQSFAFHGYLPVDEDARNRRIRELEAESGRQQRTQLFIETPYRNERMFEALRTVCAPTTRLCVARDLSLDSEWIATRTVAAWRKSAAPELARHPTVFLILAG